MKKKEDSMSFKYFHDCEICRAMRNAEERGASLSASELKAIFHKANAKQSLKDQRGFVFEVLMLDQNSKISKTFICPASWNLYKLAEFIIHSFKFNFDHAFGFFDKEDMYKSERKYELFADMIELGEDIEPTGAESVKHTYISDVWLDIGDRMFFLFDYGDGWMFKVTLKDIVKGLTEPKLLKSEGRLPKQYA